MKFRETIYLGAIIMYFIQTLKPNTGLKSVSFA